MSTISLYEGQNPIPPFIKILGTFMMDKENIVKTIYERMVVDDKRTVKTAGSKIRSFVMKCGSTRKRHL